MRPSELVHQHRAEILHLVQQFHIVNPRIFGSIAKQKDHDQSDLDLLVDPIPQTTMFDLCGLQVELEDLLGIKVDILTPMALPEKFRQQVLAEAKPL